MDITQLGIGKEELLELAATKLADHLADLSELESAVTEKIDERISRALGDKLRERIDSFLTAELTKLVDQKFTPVDMWGESTGKPTTIREALSERAKKFWEMPVDEHGRESTYGGTPRHERLYGKIVREAFEQAVKENAELIVSKFKEAIRADALKLTADHINKLIPMR